MKRNPLVYSVFALALLAGTTSCKHNEAPALPTQEVIKDSANSATVTTLEQLMSNIPAPMDISKELAKEGVQMNTALLNSPDKASSYSGTLQQAVNMGVYGADMGYVISYNQMQQGMQYMAQVAKLAQGLGITSAYDQKLMDMFKNSSANKDSIALAVQTAFDQAQKELYSNKRAATSSLVFAGGWIEGLYIATNLVKDEKNDKNAAMYQKIWDHVYSFQYIQKVLTGYKASNADCASMLQTLQPLFDAASQLKDSGLQLKDVQALKDAVTQIRSKLV